jgi:hypothetical protein
MHNLDIKVSYLDLSISDLYIILWEGVETRKVFNVTIRQIEASPMPGASDDSISKSPVDKIGTIVRALVANGKHLAILLGHQTGDFISQRKLSL